MSGDHGHETIGYSRRFPAKLLSVVRPCVADVFIGSRYIQFVVFWMAWTLYRSFDKTFKSFVENRLWEISPVERTLWSAIRWLLSAFHQTPSVWILIWRILNIVWNLNMTDVARWWISHLRSSKIVEVLPKKHRYHTWMGDTWPIWDIPRDLRHSWAS